MLRVAARRGVSWRQRRRGLGGAGERRWRSTDEEEEARREAKRREAIEQEERIKMENKEMVDTFSRLAGTIEVEERRMPTQFGDAQATIDFSNAIRNRQKTAEERKRVTPAELQAAFAEAADIDETARTLEGLGIDKAKVKAICTHFAKAELLEVEDEKPRESRR